MSTLRLIRAYGRSHCSSTTASCAHARAASTRSVSIGAQACGSLWPLPADEAGGAQLVPRGQAVAQCTIRKASLMWQVKQKRRETMTLMLMTSPPPPPPQVARISQILLMRSPLGMMTTDCWTPAACLPTADPICQCHQTAVCRVQR